MMAICSICIHLSVNQVRSVKYTNPYPHHANVGELRACAEASSCGICVLLWRTMDELTQLDSSKPAILIYNGIPQVISLGLSSTGYLAVGSGNTANEEVIMVPPISELGTQDVSAFYPLQCSTGGPTLYTGAFTCTVTTTRFSMLPNIVFEFIAVSPVWVQMDPGSPNGFGEFSLTAVPVF
jgi:hypothetical protein